MKVNFTETVLRDANQSLIATRMPYEDFEAILPELDKAGYYSLECWGGATFDSCLRYLNEDPWERLRKIRKACPNTKLQMLLRGQNLLGYKHYPDDVVRLFVRKSVENGIDIIRIFDALNDLRNIETAVDETIKCGAHASGTICYTTSPIHNIESYIKLAKDLESMGVQSVCIKDMAGIMDPQTAYDLVKGIKENISLPVIVHTHSTTGLGPVTLQKAVEAGADVIDTAISCFSNGTSQPPTETMAYILQKEGYEVPLDMAQLKKINDFFKPVRSQERPAQPRRADHSDRRAQLSDPRRNAFEPCRSAHRSEQARQARRSSRRDSESPRRPRLSSARHPDEPDGRRSGDRKCARG